LSPQYPRGASPRCACLRMTAGVTGSREYRPSAPRSIKLRPVVVPNLGTSSRENLKRSELHRGGWDDLRGAGQGGGALSLRQRERRYGERPWQEEPRSQQIDLFLLNHPSELGPPRPTRVPRSSVLDSNKARIRREADGPLRRCRERSGERDGRSSSRCASGSTPDAQGAGNDRRTFVAGSRRNPAPAG
jgi:hypothetical protein